MKMNKIYGLCAVQLMGVGVQLMNIFLCEIKPGIKDMCCVQRVRDMSFHNIVKMLLLFYRGQWRQTM